jgi:IclR family acetate operon transcriptional repressor
MKERDPYFSRAVEKALAALAFVRASAEPVALQEIAAKVKLTKASAFRLVYTLEALGHLTKAGDGKYFAAPESPHAQLVKRAGKPLERLNMEFGETASLAGLFDSHIEVLLVFESQQIMRMGNTVGRILPPNASSLGKAITAFQTAEVADKLVRSYGAYRFTPQTIVDEIAMREELARVRASGVAEDVEESIAGGRCFAAPVLGVNGHAAGAVSLSLPLIRYRGDAQRQKILTAVRKTARAIEKLL